MIKVSHKTIDKQNIYYIINWYQTLEEEKKYFMKHIAVLVLLTQQCMFVDCIVIIMWVRTLKFVGSERAV